MRRKARRTLGVYLIPKWCPVPAERSMHVNISSNEGNLSPSLQPNTSLRNSLIALVITWSISVSNSSINSKEENSL